MLYVWLDIPDMTYKAIANAFQEREMRCFSSDAKSEQDVYQEVCVKETKALGNPIESALV